MKKAKKPGFINILDFMGKKSGDKLIVSDIGEGIIGEIDNYNNCFYLLHKDNEHDGSRGKIENKDYPYSWSMYMEYSDNEAYKVMLSQFNANLTTQKINKLLAMNK